MVKENAPGKILLLLQIATVCVFAGRAYQHLFWDAPFREFLWDPFWMQGFIEKFSGMTWREYVTNPAGDIWIQRFVFAEGIFYTLCALSAVFIRRLPGKVRWLLWVGAANLIMLALIYQKDHFYQVGQFFEYTLQFSSPIFLLILLKKKHVSRTLIFWMKVAVALTFTCHGLYAIGYYPRPGSFYVMTYNNFGFDKEGMKYFLNTAGTIDLLLAAGIFLPWRGVKWLLAYAAVWGLATTLARIFGNFYWDFPLESLHQWAFQAVFRMPHFLVPFALFLWMQNKAVK
jgi:hypothetical protein